ncbi:Nif3-like dinuclear metal center hexameric protein, partial [Lactobacillus salivarius]|nr:Nif3-like dinuclear metal center hexameric protein [Ligilactobacillus salivarius]
KYSMGRVGELKDSLTAVEFAEYCKKVLNLRGLRLIAADNQKPVKRVAVLGGSGGRFFNAALLHKADAYVTGDISYHTGHDMIAA